MIHCDGSLLDSITDGAFQLYVPSADFELASENVRLLIKKPQITLMTK